jgi:hypothetical protein
MLHWTYCINIIGHKGYGSACHAGAAIEALCYGTAANLSESYNQFYYNYSAYDPTTGEVYQPGLISWLLPYTGEDGPAFEPEALAFELSWASNVYQAIFSPGSNYGSYLSFHPENGTFYISSAIDDSSFNATYPSSEPYLSNLDRFYLCYQDYSGYYYQSLAWVATDPPHNPSCEPVNVAMVTIS